MSEKSNPYMKWWRALEIWNNSKGHYASNDPEKGGFFAIPLKESNEYQAVREIQTDKKLLEDFPQLKAEPSKQTILKGGKSRVRASKKSAKEAEKKIKEPTNVLIIDKPETKIETPIEEIIEEIKRPRGRPKKEKPISKKEGRRVKKQLRNKVFKDLIDNIMEQQKNDIDAYSELKYYSNDATKQRNMGQNDFKRMRLISTLELIKNDTIKEDALINALYNSIEKNIENNNNKLEISEMVNDLLDKKSIIQLQQNYYGKSGKS